MDSSNEILEISKQFMAGVSIKCIKFMLKSLEHCGDKSWQRRLLQSTVQNRLVLKYPPSKNYQSLFLKSLIEKVEMSGMEVVEEMYELYTGLMLSMAKNEVYSYKIYCVKPELNVILKESTSLISQGTTGLVTWQAAKALTEWCVENEDLLKGKNVIELGCGVGLTGIVVCKTCQPISYRFTDCHPQVLDLLRHNLEVNFENIRGELPGSTLNGNDTDVYHWGLTHISVTPFHWDDDAAIEAILRDSKPDIILAADVIYDISTIHCLVKVLKLFLNNATQHEYGGSTTVYLACTLRNEDTLDAFYKEVGKYFSPSPLEKLLSGFHR